MQPLRRLEERRKYPRFKVQTDIFVLHADFGHVVDIGLGGLFFTYIDIRTRTKHRPKIGVLFSRDDDYLVELPFTTLSDCIYRRATCGKPPLRKRTVVFAGLSPDQQKKLEHFILYNISTSAMPSLSPTYSAD